MPKQIHTKIITNSRIHNATDEFYEDCKIVIQIIDCLGENCANITFICLIDDIAYLARGYLASIGITEIEHIKVQNNNIVAYLNIKKEIILEYLQQKEIIQTCESIHTSDIKNTQNSIIVPFNGSKHTLTISEILHYAKFFQTNTASDQQMRICQIVHNNYIVESCDINTKNALYKTIGKAILEFGDLLDSALIINWTLDLEILKKILCCKITFVMFIGKPSFYVLKYAQKFGITLIEYKNSDTLSILTHQVRIK